MKRFLVATDLSERSAAAIARGLQLAESSQGEATILHVIPEFMTKGAEERLRDAARSAIDERLAALPASQRSSVRVKILGGSPFRRIVRESEDGDADLIIVGAHRPHTIKDMFIGTTAERVCRYGDRPVLIVVRPPGRPYRAALVAVDFSIYSARAVAFARGLLPNGEHHVVHVYDVPFAGLIDNDLRRDQYENHVRAEVEGTAQAFLATAGAASARLHLIRQTGNIAEAIREQATRLGADLVVVGTHGRPGVARALLGSVAQDLLSDPACDTAAVKAW